MELEVFKRLMAKGKKIYHRNDLRHSLASMNLPSRRVLWLILAQLDRDESNHVIFNHDRVFTITAKMYADLCNIDESVAYKQLKDAVEEIRTHLMRIPESELLSPEEFAARNRPKDGMVLFTVANYSYYTDGEGFIEVQLDPIMAPFISKLSNNFTGQFLLSALRLPDSNANKLYMLLREWISGGKCIEWTITVDELRGKLGLLEDDAYKEYDSFRRFFFGRAVKSILKTTEFKKIEMVIVERLRRKAHKVRISYEYDGQSNDLKNSGFYLGQQKKVKQASEDQGQPKVPKNKDEKPDHQPGQATKSADMKQINGKWETRKSAEAAGYIWDDY